MTSKLTAIMTVSDDNVVGIDGPNGPALPWRLPPDLQRFKKLTTGHAVIMGRKTFDSIGRSLPNRENVVVSRRKWGERFDPSEPVWIPNGSCVIASTPEMALADARDLDPKGEPYVIGGPEIWSALWSHVAHVELTRVHVTVGLGKVFAFHAPLWRETYHALDGEHEGVRFTFQTFVRVAPDSTLERLPLFGLSTGHGVGAK